jgi:two-component system NarL family response regulator
MGQFLGPDKSDYRECRMSERKPCVLVADDSPEMRRMLCRYLPTWGCEAVTAGDGREALALAATHPPNVALVDVVMPGPAGMELVRRLKERYPDVAAIIITGYASIEGAAEAMHQGAFHYLPKPLDMRRLRSLVQEVWEEREAHGADRMADTLGLREPLSQREQQVLAALAEGKTDEEIAVALSVSTSTVSTHVRHILGKLGANNRVQAAILWERWTEHDARGYSAPRSERTNT